MDSRGRFDYLSIPDILMFAGRKRLSCTLQFKSSHNTLKMFIERGKVSFVSSDNKDDRFGEYLLYRGKITYSQYKLTSEKLMEGKGKLGYLLVQQGFITFEELLSELIEYIFYLTKVLFNFKSGKYVFLKPAEDTSLPLELHLDIRRIVFYGIKNQNFLSFIENTIPSIEFIPSLDASPDLVLKTLNLDVDEQTIFEWINGKNSVSSICDYSPLGEFQTLKVLSALSRCGFIKKSAEKDKKLDEHNLELQIEDLVKKYNDYFQIIYNYLNEKNENTFIAIHDNALKTLNELFPEKVGDINLYNYGYLDFDVFYKNIFSISLEERFSFSEKILKEFVKELIFETGKFLGDPEMKILKKQIRNQPIDERTN